MRLLQRAERRHLLLAESTGRKTRVKETAYVHFCQLKQQSRKQKQKNCRRPCDSTAVVMATAALPPQKLGKCANCLLFDWAERGVGVKLQQCKQCKVLEYCGQACQEEHWKLVHKSHCKKMARAFEEEGEWSIFSHHPFPKDGLEDDIGETLVGQVQLR